MGYDIYAYFDVDQCQLDQFICQQGIDKKKWETRDQVTAWYKETHLKECKQNLSIVYYHWNERCGIHEVFTSYRTNFIRDDERFDNRRYQMLLEKKVGRPFPHCLKQINWTLRTREDALEIASELRIFFPDDERLLYFADWLDATAEFCSTYELSY